MGRSPCCEKDGLKKGPWTPEEDQKLLAYIEQHGHGCWRSLPAKAGELDRKLVPAIVDSCAVQPAAFGYAVWFRSFVLH